MLTALIIILAVALMVLMVAMCKVSSRADEDAERMAAAYVPTATPAPTPEPVPEDVWLLAKIMQCEAGVDWPDWAVMLIGEVIMNRVEAPHFPNNIHDVLYAANPVQYEPVYSKGWDDVIPDDDYIDLAWRLVNGERALGDKTMLYQALFPQGTATLITYYDKVLDTRTYFCRG